MPLLAVIREAIRDGMVTLVYCPTQWMVADILTSQATRGSDFVTLRSILLSGHQQTYNSLKNSGKDFKNSPMAAMFR